MRQSIEWWLFKETNALLLCKAHNVSNSVSERGPHAASEETIYSSGDNEQICREVDLFVVRCPCHGKGDKDRAFAVFAERIKPQIPNTRNWTSELDYFT